MNTELMENVHITICMFFNLSISAFALYDDFLPYI